MIDTVKKNRERPYFTLSIDEKYKNFEDFYEKNKTTIYEGILKLFKGLTRTKKDSLTFIVNWASNGLKIKTDFVFYKSEYDMLIKLILPYFESIEEYEICGKIIEVYKKLK